MTSLEDRHVRETAPLIAPRALKETLPANRAAEETVIHARAVIERIARREDPRLLVVVGPCSIHDPRAAQDYAALLNRVRPRYEDRLFIVMRAYFEKPRTTIGWRGLINDPHIDGSFDMATGIQRARELLLHITETGLPVATEMLDPITPQYFADLVSWAAIGARTTESQTHRALASGLSMPIGFKNGTDGAPQVAIDALVSAAHPHSFLGVSQDGGCCVVQTTGNPYGLLILRGGRSGPNYDADSLAAAARRLTAAGREPSLMIDCSHANSGYDCNAQVAVWQRVIAQRAAGNTSIVGVMVESNLVAGKQSIPADLADLRYGQSITDACVDWETTERMLDDAYAALAPEGKPDDLLVPA